MTGPKRDMFAVTTDGVIVVNILALNEKDPPRLALQKGLFVGVALTAEESKLLGENVYDAMAETAARINGERRRGPRRP